MQRFAFPFGRIKKDSRLIIYGAGEVGHDLVRAVEETRYCILLCVLDKEAEKHREVYNCIHTPDYMEQINNDDYDMVLIAVEKKNVAEKMKETLLQYGVPACKIMVYSPIYMRYSENTNDERDIDDDGNDVYKLAVCCYKALGDKLLSILPIVAMRKLLPTNLIIHTYSEYGFYVDVSFIDGHFYQAKPPEDNDYDAVISLYNFISISRYSRAKTKRLSEGLARYFDHVSEYTGLFPSFVTLREIVQYAEIIGTHKTMHHNTGEALPYRCDTVPPFQFDTNAFAILVEHQLVSKRYITISMDSSKHVLTAAKLWPSCHYKTLMALIRQNHPSLRIVLVGESVPNETFEGLADVNLCGKTNVSEICCLLKHSLLHIGTEGGLIHLNRGVGGKSCCLFGMTLPKRYAYEENINLRSNEPKNCAIGCEGLLWGASGWHCVYEDEWSRCMQNLLPEYVYENIAEYLQKARFPLFELSQTMALNEIITLFSDKENWALIGRYGDEDILPHLDKTKKLTVFNMDLSDEPINPKAPINLLYAERLKPLGATAEYGTIHNVPSPAARFDVVISFSLSEMDYREYALMELFRIAKPDGIVAVLNDKGEFAVYQQKEDTSHVFVSV
jgi:ADP-heptose:LPS heptosyltransferase